ncbi:MAG: response regulator transcription factor [Verrucomicrobiota bacterium]|nr:response regulator transcription factor [Verrucomicrobiota bacterium]
MQDSISAPSNFLRGKRVVLVEDETLFLHLTSRYLTEYLGMQVVGQARDGKEGLKFCRKLKPDVALIDLRLPLLSGNDLARMLMKELPKIKLVIVSAVHEPEIVAELVKMKIPGYISKMDSHVNIADALTAVLSNQVYYSSMGKIAVPATPPIVNHPRLQELTPRERQVLFHVANGLTNKEISKHLEIQTKTVEAHRARLSRKLGVTSTVGLVVFAAKTGLIKI